MRLLPQSPPSGGPSRSAHWSRALLAISLAVSGICHAQVISEIYGGGGNSGATYTNDFIELHNPTAVSVSLAGYAVQYAAATGTSWTVINLSGSIPANGRYLVQLDSGGAVGVSLPSPDVIGSLNISATGGKVALTNTTVALTGTGIAAVSVVDFVGYGSTASASEGGAPAPAGSNTTSIARDASGTDSNNNAADFTAGPPSPVGTGIDNLAPTVVTLIPADGSTTATTTQNLVITFSEPIVIGTGNITIKLTTGNSTVETIDVTSASVTVSGTTVTIDPVSDLLANTGYYINIPNTAFKDAANNFYVGISTTAAWNFSIPAPAGTLLAGDIAFVGLANASASNDYLSFVALKAIPAGEVIRFTDNEWNGSAIGSGGAFVDPNEGYIIWNSPVGGVPQGTVVRLDKLDASTRSASLGTVTTTGSFNLSSTDSVYAFQGGATTPAQFLAFMTNNGTTDSVANTGLTASNIVSLTSTTNHYQYTGTRSGQPSFSSYLALVSDTATNWTTSPSTGDPALTFVMTAFTIGAGNNTPPTITDIANLSVPSGSNTGALTFTLGDTETDVSLLTVTGSSSNTTLVPNANIVFGGSGASRTVVVTPVSGLSGTATITVTVTDTGSPALSNTPAETFVLTVTDNYLSWATANSVTGGTNGDSDNDGVQNLVEYALVNGGERGVFSGNTITFTKRGTPYGSDISYIIETSETLAPGSWTEVVTHGPSLLISNPTISYTFTPSTPVKSFARLKVVQ